MKNILKNFNIFMLIVFGFFYISFIFLTPLGIIARISIKETYFIE